MRLAMILDMMQKALSADRVAANMQEMEKFCALFPVLKQEQANIQYLFDKLMGNPIRKSFLFLNFKEG